MYFSVIIAQKFSYTLINANAAAADDDAVKPCATLMTPPIQPLSCVVAFS